MSTEPFSKLQLIELAKNDPKAYKRLMKDFGASSPTEMIETANEDLDYQDNIHAYRRFVKANVAKFGDKIKTSLPSFQEWVNSPDEE